MTLFRVRFAVAGAHVHCRLFAAPAANQTFAKCGDFVTRRGAEFRDLLAAAQYIEFVGDDPTIGIAEAIREDEGRLGPSLPAGGGS